jgi:hypothetical protein
MNEETYHKVSDAIEAISFDEWMSSDLTLEERELARQEYCAKWAKVCKDNGITILEYDLELERRLDRRYGLVQKQ